MRCKGKAFFVSVQTFRRFFSKKVSFVAFPFKSGPCFPLYIYKIRTDFFLLFPASTQPHPNDAGRPPHRHHDRPAYGISRERGLSLELEFHLPFLVDTASRPTLIPFVGRRTFPAGGGIGRHLPPSTRPSFASARAGCAPPCGAYPTVHTGEGPTGSHTDVPSRPSVVVGEYACGESCIPPAIKNATFRAYAPKVARFGSSQNTSPP